MSSQNVNVEWVKNVSDLNQITQALERLFNQEGQRIVFWNDPDREFQITLSMLELQGVTTLRLDEVGALEAKIRLERDEPTAKFLVYAPAEEPEYEDDWLLDIRLYSRSFTLRCDCHRYLNGKSPRRQQ